MAEIVKRSPKNIHEKNYRQSARARQAGRLFARHPDARRQNSFSRGPNGYGCNRRDCRADDVVAQFRLALTNLHAVVTDAGAQMTDIVKLNIFVVNKKAYQAHAREIGQVYREFFGKYYPTMTLVEVKSLYDDNALLEIEGIAAVEGESEKLKAKS